jgi:hypothetical protein
MVLAVNWPGHEPEVGRQERVRCSRLGALQAAGKNAANRLVGVDNVDVTAGDAAG